MNKTFNKLKEHLEIIQAFTEALTLYDWDLQTQAPKESMDYNSKTIGILSNEYYKALVNLKVRRLLEKLETDKEFETLDSNEKAIVRKLRKTYNGIAFIPQQEYREFSEFSAKSVSKWEKAKENKDFNEFVPALKEMIDYKKKFISYRKSGRQKIYDILLEDYEEGFKMQELDIFFEKIKEALIPLVKQVSEKSKTIDKSYNHQKYDIQKQKEFCKWLSGYLGFNFNRGIIGESTHPFTTNLSNHDVRITNHFNQENLESAIFSAIHETGHAIYEMNVSDELTQTIIGGGASCGMHESQSRFFENIIGKSHAFWEYVYPKLVATFPEQLKDVSLDEFLIGINKSAPSPVRIEADELTYTFHIIIRYEIEKMIFQNKVKVENLSKVWNKKYKEYLGIIPENDSEGILQDIHWAGGDFGYFSSYAIGNAIAAQIYYYMKSIMPFDEYLRQGNITPIREFLNSNIHQYGMKKNTNEILKDLMNEELSVDYFIRYMREKYTKLFNLGE